MRIRKIFIGLMLVFAAAVVLMPAAWALPVNDGFTAAKTVESRYFLIGIAPGVDVDGLLRTLDIPPGHKILSGQSMMSGSLPDMMDALFLWAGGVLDMQLYSYKGNVKIVADGRAMQDIYRRLYGQESYSEKGFYIFELNTLYMSQDAFTKEILGHEIGHMIISNFFVVQPPAKVQEVLAGYIEYQLRKGSPRK